MKFLLLPAASAILIAAFAALPPPALAKGCLKGAVVGGAARHYAGQHAVLGAVRAASSATIQRPSMQKKRRSISSSQPRTPPLKAAPTRGAEGGITVT